MKTLDFLFNYTYNSSNKIRYRQNEEYIPGLILSSKDQYCNRILIHITELGHILVKENVIFPTKHNEYIISSPEVFIRSQLLSESNSCTVESFMAIFGYTSEGFAEQSMHQKLTMLKQAFYHKGSVF